MNPSPRRLAAAAVLAAGLLTAACGGSSKTDTTTADQTTSTTAKPSGSSATTPSAADVTYVQGMLPHHEQAIELAELALDPRAQASPAVKTLAGTIRTESDPEIKQLRTWLTDWGKEEMDMTGDMSDHSMGGMATQQDLDDLETLTGAEFDSQWLTLMVAHHEGATEMAGPLKAGKGLSEVTDLADEVNTRQGKQVTEMRALLSA